MLDEDTLCVIHPERVRLGFCRVGEFCRSNTDCWDPLDFKPDRVMQTARGTGSSVCQPFNDEVDIGFDILADIRWSWFGECGFFESLHL